MVECNLESWYYDVDKWGALGIRGRWQYFLIMSLEGGDPFVVRRTNELLHKPSRITNSESLATFLTGRDLPWRTDRSNCSSLRSHPDATHEWETDRTLNASLGHTHEHFHKAASARIICLVRTITQGWWFPSCNCPYNPALLCLLVWYKDARFYQTWGSG